MLNYLEYLLETYNNIPVTLKSVRNIFIVDDTSSKLIINLILDTELKSYILNLVDYKLEKYTDINSDFDIVKIDEELRNFGHVFVVRELYDIFKRHENPIWRLAAFFCNFIIIANEVYNNAA